MIPVLYESTATTFTSFGIGALAECTECTVTEERNGTFELQLKYPVNAALFGELQIERIIKAKPNDLADDQAFRIYRISKPILGTVTVYAQHLSYDLGGVGEMPWSSSSMSPSLVLSKILTEATDETNFTLTTDFSSAQPFAVTEPKSVRATLGGSEGSMLDVWGGEWEWNNWTCTLHSSRGADTGVVIEYGKNLTDLTDATDTTSAWTHLLPYAVQTDEDGNEIIVTLTEKVLPITTTLTVGKVIVRDFSDKFDIDATITESALRTVAQAYIDANSLGIPERSITVKFEPLWKQPEYAAVLERLRLCDMVTVRYAKLGVNVKQKVVRTVYDTLLERYNEITLGTVEGSMTDTVVSIEQQIADNERAVERFPAKINAAITAATELITGQTGGYIVIRQDADTGYPYEILIMDYPDVDDAVNVWRWNLGGLGFSSNGVNGPYTTAITADGAIVADFITAGTIDANLLRAGVIMSPDGESYWDLESGAIKLVSYDTAISSLSEQAANTRDEANAATEAVAAMETRVADLEVANAAITAKFSAQLVGGVNFIRNSSGQNGTNGWTSTGTTGAVADTDAVQNTVAGSAFTVNASSSLVQKVTGLVPGTYTISLKAKREGGRSDYLSSVILTHDGVDETIYSTKGPFVWTKFTKTVTISGSDATLTLSCRAGVQSVADIIMTQGETEHAWTPAPNEIYTTQVKVDRSGIEVSNADSRQRTVITNTEFAGYYDEEKIFTLNKDETVTKKTTVDGELTVGNVKFIPTSTGGLGIAVLD